MNEIITPLEFRTRGTIMKQNKLYKSYKFFCRYCGKEIWQEVDFSQIKVYTLEELVSSAICSDCEFNQIELEGE